MGADSLNSQINNTQQQSKQNVSKEKKIKLELKTLIKNIYKTEKESKKISKEIKNLKIKIKEKSKSYDKNIKDKDKFTNKIQSLNEKKDSLEQNISDLLLKNFSLVKNKIYPDTNDIINHDIVQILHKITKKNISSLQTQHAKQVKKVKSTQKDLAQITKKLKIYTDKQTKMQKLETKQKKILAKLKKTKQKYKKELANIAKKKKEIQKILQKLYLEKQSKTNYSLPQDIDTTTVKLVNSSYSKAKVYKYTGKKVSSPLKSSTLKRKFGNAIDPIYKIKSFNNAIILKSNTINAKVRNIIDGTIVFLSNTKLLKNIVIIKTKSNLNLIYSNIDTISPIIKVGKSIKAGYAIGRVKEFLNFEVAYKKYNIDPMQLIKGLK